MESLPKIVVTRLQSLAAESHPDADLLTAFAEYSLAGAERGRVTEHLARCGECREVVSLALPPQVDLQPVAGTSGNWLRGALLRGSALRWTAVAAGLALIASFGVMQYRRQRPTEFASNLSQPSPAIDAPQAQALPKANQAVPEAGTETKNLNDEKLNDKKLNGKNLNEKLRTRISSAAPATQIPASQPDKLPGQQVLIAAAPAQIDPGQSEASFDRVDKAKPASPQSSPALVPHADPTPVKNAAVRWTISTTGALQHSLDGGQTWRDVNIASDGKGNENQTENENAPAIFRTLSVSSNASEVWAGGSGGALYHTTDGGNRWARVSPSAAGTVLTGDIISIQFTDPRIGTITTSTNEVWITLDNGQSWRRQ